MEGIEVVEVKNKIDHMTYLPGMEIGRAHV